MKKKILIIFVFMLCMFGVKNVYAECTWKENFFTDSKMSLMHFYQTTSRTKHKVGDTINVSFYTATIYDKIDSDSVIEVLLKSTSTGEIVSVELSSFGLSNADNKQAYDGSYVIPDTFKLGEYVYYGLNIKKQDQDNQACGRYIFNANDLEDNKDYYAVEIGFPSDYKTITVVDDNKPENDILKSVSLYTYTSNYYIGDKMTFNVETTEEISSMNITFAAKESNDGHGYGSFTVYLTPEGPHTNIRSFSGYIPKTIAGYYGTQENGRTEMTVYPGTYEVSSIFVYDTNGKLIRYTTDKKYSEDSDFIYYPYIIGINLKEPTSDELNDVNFVLEKLSIKDQKASIGKDVSLDIDYSYDNTNKTIKSIYLIFRDSSKKRTFTSYVKALTEDPFFIVAASADLTTYKLDSIGVTFEAKDGTNNTIILNSESASGKYKELFSQELTIEESTEDPTNKDKPLYFSAEELNNEVFSRIKDNKDETEVVINADNYTIIPAELFDLIKDDNKQLIVQYNNNEWIFKGTNIKNSKNIDVTIKIYDINESDLGDNLKSSLENGTLIIEFANNGDLPEEALIRIKDQKILNKLTEDKYYIYYADTENSKLDKVALEVQKTADGYIEFYIKHNSKYVLSSKEISDDKIIGKDDVSLNINNELIKESNKNNNNILLYLIIALVCITLIVILVIFLKKKKNHKNEVIENNNEETKNEDKKND